MMLDAAKRLLAPSRRSEVRARVRYVPSLRSDVVFLPFHFPGEQRANLLTNPALDPTSRMPEFKVCAVRLAPVPEPARAEAPLAEVTTTGGVG